MSRGAIKYQPFKALDGHEEALRERESRLKKVNKPILSEDDCQRINDALLKVINEKISATFCYYRNNNITQITSKVNKVMNGYLYLEEDRILISDLTDILI